MRRLLRWLVYGLAAAGLLGSAATVYLYLEGRKAEERLDPKAALVYREFARRLIDEDAASASVLKMPLGDGVSVKDALASMESRAAERNLKLVGRVTLARAGKDGSGVRAEVLQFCDSATALALLEYNLDFIAHMPCSIGLYQGSDGKAWLVTLNLDLLIHGGREISPELKQRVLTVKEGLLDVMAAGAAGAL